MSFNRMAIFDKLDEQKRFNRYNKARKLIDFWADQYQHHRSKIKWAECKIITEKENLLDNLFFKADVGDYYNLLTNIVLSLIFKEKVKLAFNFYLEDFTIILSDNLEVVADRSDFRAFMAALDLKYDKSTSILCGSKIMMGLFTEWLSNNKINFKIVKDSYKILSDNYWRIW